MPSQYLSVAAATKIMGMNRSILQHKMKTGEIKSFEGKVNFESLKASCPTAKAINTSHILERLQFIKDNAYANRILTAQVPESHRLLSQLKKARLDLKMQRQESLRYLSVINELRNRLQTAETEISEKPQDMANQLLSFIHTQLNQPLSRKHHAHPNK